MINSLLVFSHLRWNFVFQRPQQLMQRLSRDWKIWFFEEPVRSPECFLERTSPAPNIVVCRPHTPIAATGFHDEQLPALQPLVDALVRDELREPYAVWMYSPMVLPLTQSLRPELMVYDCMDELSAFRNAPIQLRQRESALLKQADLVFTGGPSLYRSKSVQHPNVHCFPSSVDAEHFRVGERLISEAEDQAELPHPRLGFYGVIDERLDLAIVDRLAEAHPEWQIVLVGPVVKIDPASLPRRPNLHYLGQRSYEELPRYLAGWDVCLLPFARNDATRFISPTKTLEYMAAELPIVSTSIRDVADLYGDIVYLGDTPDGFLAACEQALGSSAQERAARAQQMRKMLAGTSWEATASAMEQLLTEVVAGRMDFRVPA
jgi:glycosyltransferase involved in cell wall biosynthesis